MTNERDGGKAMSVYIAVCLVLTLGAAVGYKLMNDKREELLSAYPRMREFTMEIDTAMMNVANYYELVRSKDLKPPSPDQLNKIPQYIIEIRDKLGLSGEIPPGARVSAQNEYTEYNLEVNMKNLTHTDWSNLVRAIKADENVGRHVTLTKFHVQRTDDNYARIAVGDGNIDGSRWNVTFTLTWYTEPPPKPSPAPKTT